MIKMSGTGTDNSPKKGQGCVESRITLFSCSTDLSWQKLVDVRSQVAPCDPHLPRLAGRIVVLGEEGRLMGEE